MNQEEKYVPFREYIPAGESTFSIQIPSYFSDREFYFSYCTLTPRIFSDQAAKFDLDVDEELNQEFSYKINIQGDYKDGLPLHPDALTIPNTETNPLNIVKAINTFFENKKPVGLARTSLFFDWFDIRFDLLENTSWDDFVRNVMAFEYYGVPFNENLHYNVLPESARSVVGANNYLFPTQRVPDVLNNIRFRIFIAPNTDFIFSTDSHLMAMGFSPAQIGKRIKNNKLKMANNYLSEYRCIEALIKPQLAILRGVQLIMNLAPHSKLFTTLPFVFKITRAENFKNVNYKTKLQEAFQDYGLECNLEFSFTYDATTRKFTFVFPNNRVFDYFNISIPSELSERLGFDLVKIITKENKTGRSVVDADSFNVDEVANQARALILDTALVLVSDYYNSSNTTAGMHNAYLTALYPNSSATCMEIPMLESCHKPATMTLSKTLASSEGFVLPKFKLSRFLDNRSFVNFRWTQGAYISGTLRGKEANKKVYKVS